jgi:hypothetical protein
MLVSNLFIVLIVQLHAYPEFRVAFFNITVEKKPRQDSGGMASVARIRLGHEVFPSRSGMQINSNNCEWSKTHIECEINHILK